MPEGRNAPRLAPILFSTAALPPAQRLDAWNAAFGRLNAIRLPGSGAPAIVHGRHWGLAGAVVSHNSITAARFVRDPLQARRDALDHWVIRVLLSGENRLRHDGFSARVLPGEPVLFAMQESWVSEWSDAEWVSVTLPRELDPELTRGLATIAPGPLRGAAAGLLGAALSALPARLNAARVQDLPGLAEGLLGLLRGCLLGDASAKPGVAAKQRAREAIRRRIASARLTPESLAAELGVSRSSLYRLFEAEGGVAREILAIRLAHAHAALADPARRCETIAAIAAASGFPDPSVFNRSFRRAFGLAPGALRRIAQVAPPGMDVAATGDVSARLYAPLPEAARRSA